MRTLATAAALSVALALAGCNQADQRKTQADAQAAGNDMQASAQALGADVKDSAANLGNDG